MQVTVAKSSFQIASYFLVYTVTLKLQVTMIMLVMKSNRSTCPIACALDSLGDRWSILIIRDLMLGSSRYGDFLKSPEKITTNILANRLKRLESEGLISKSPYQDNPVRWEYSLTLKGRDLSNIIKGLVNWGLTYIEGTSLPGDKWNDFSSTNKGKSLK